jgi:cysteine synthase A
MKKIYPNITAAIGNTPLVRVERFSQYYTLKTPLLVKPEFLNPGGSVKERVALAMVDDAEKRGLLKEGSTIIEPTSGNTGIGLAIVAAVRSYKIILTMPETMSLERRKLLKAYGAQLVLTDGSKGMHGAIEKAQELHKTIPNSFIPSQFDNKANVKAHYNTTAKEIWNDSNNLIDIFVCGVGTGGTITGVGSFLKEQNKNIKIVAVEPANSAILSGFPAGKHQIQGIGAGFIPSILDRTVIDEIVKVEEKRAFETANILAKTEGILAGISSGAALWGAIEVAQKEENSDKTVVVILPDSGDRYYSTQLFTE